MHIGPSWFAVVPVLIASKSEIDEMCSLIERSLLQALVAVGSRQGPAA
jgi:hypothetical protein